MSTAAVSSLSIFQELQSFYQNRQTDLKQLGSALRNGDLAGAQQAYSALAVLGEGGPFANSEPFAKSSRAQAFNTLGEALQAGDLARAQASFATLTANQGNSATSAQAASASIPAAVVNLTGAQPSNTTATDTGSASSIYRQLQGFRQQRQADLTQLGQALQSGDLTRAQKAFDALTALGQSGPNKNGQVFSRTDREQAFEAVGKALQSGDLAGAQSAFANLSATFGRQNQQAQTAISAYNSGVTEIVINLIPPPTGTEGPVTQPPRFIGPPILQQPPTQPPRFIGPPILQQPPTEPTISQSPSSGTTVNGSVASGAPELVINLGGASGTSASGGSTPEIIVNLGQGSSSSSPEEVTINFGRGSSGAQISIDTTQGQNGSPAEQVTINLNQRNNYELVLNLFNSISTSQAQINSSNAVSLHA